MNAFTDVNRLAGLGWLLWTMNAKRKEKQKNPTKSRKRLEISVTMVSKPNRLLHQMSPRVNRS